MEESKELVSNSARNWFPRGEYTRKRRMEQTKIPYTQTKRRLNPEIGLMAIEDAQRDPRRALYNLLMSEGGLLYVPSSLDLRGTRYLNGRKFRPAKRFKRTFKKSKKSRFHRKKKRS